MTDHAAVDVAGAAAMYGVSRDTIYAAVNKRELPAKKVGRGIRIDVSALREWFNNLPDASPEAVEP